MLSAAGDLPWTAQLGILVPFLLAFGWVGKQLFSQNNELRQSKDALYERIMADVIPAMAAMTAAANELIRASADMRRERDTEREARIRAEERNRK